MSGLEGLAALSLACSIFQVVTFGRETLILVKDIYRNGTIDGSLMDKSAAIQDVASDIIAVEIPRPLGKHEQKLVDVMKKCTGVARDLQDEIAFLAGHKTRRNLREALKAAVKVNWRKRRLERMEKDLADSEQVMQSSLLAWIFKSSNRAGISIDSLEEKMRDFVIKYEQGCRHASELVSKEALSMREVIARESGKTEKAVQAHVTQLTAKAEQRFQHHIDQNNREWLREKVLQSLKYPGMNERANQIEDAHAHTFRWLFADADGEQFLDTSEDAYRGLPSKGPEMAWSSFTDWLQSDLSFYWIMGKPGSGKSTLAKFIQSEPRTKVALERWRQDVVIVTHYFWRPGGPLQASIKGMLCSIAYQLIIAIPNALEYASANVFGLSQKDAHTDWSIPELQRFCICQIPHCGKPICLFIDGLDECGPEDDHQKLLDMLDELRRQNVKIVASSRNEPVFERRFRHEPQLRMQDLTADDMRAYATETLRPEIRDDFFFVTELVDRAEGVFLWLVLAVQSINRGLGNGERLEDLRRRMESLPKRLNDFYKDMWERLHDDGVLYQRSAALYFRLVIAAQNSRLKCLEHGFSVMEMMLASSNNSLDGFAGSPEISATQLLEECEGFCKRVKARCAGLLGVYMGRARDFEQESFGGPESAVLEYATKNVRFQFIHRSVHDFLVGTAEGQTILRHDEVSSEDLDLRFFSASLRTAQLFYLILGKETEYRGIQFKIPSQDLNLYLSDLSSIADARESAVSALLSLCYELYRIASLMFEHWDRRHTRDADFFGAVASYPNLDQYAISVVENQVIGSNTRSAVLLCILDRREGLRLKLARRLLHLPEMDVNLKCPMLLPRPGTISAVYGYELGPLDHIKSSPFTRLLGIGLETLDWRPMKLIRHRHRAMQFLQLVSDFVLHGADFRSTVFLAFRLDALKDLGSVNTDNQVWPGGFFQIPGWDSSNRHPFEYRDDSVLCVMAIQATTVIHRMVDSLLQTELGHDIIDEDGFSLTEDNSSSSDLAAAVSILSSKCEEHGRSADDRVLGFLQPFDNFSDIPYRQVNKEDSANLTRLMFARMFDMVSWSELRRGFKVAVARSPFSSIGFRDYLRNIECFDELAATKLFLEYEEEQTGPYY